MKPLSRIVLFVGLAIVLVAVLVGVYFYTLGQKDLTNAKPDYTLPARELYADFEADENAASAKYLDKVVEVSGIVSHVEMNSDSAMNVMLMNDSDMGGVLCTFNNVKKRSSIDVSPGDKVIIRGICSGMLMDVQLNNCVMVGEK